jgi:GNAT superfamily N-acetyltransferase
MHILQKQGLAGLLKRGFTHFLDWAFRYEPFYVHLHLPDDIGKFNERDFFPDLESWDYFIVQDNREADALERRGFEFRSRIFMSRRALDAGGIAILVFVDRKIASINWIALNEVAQKILGEPPKRINFAGRESITSGAQTLPEFRNRGLFAYTMFKTREYLRDNGIVRDWGLTSRRNKSSVAVVRKFNPRCVGMGYWWRILGIDFYIEKEDIADI